MASQITGLESVWYLLVGHVKTQSNNPRTARQLSLQLVTIFPIMATLAHRKPSSAGTPCDSYRNSRTSVCMNSFVGHNPASKSTRISMVRRVMGAASNAGIPLPTAAAPLTRRTEPSVTPTRKLQQHKNEYTSKKF